MEDGEIVWEEYSPFPRGKREEQTPSKYLKIIILDMLIFLGYVKEKSSREIVSQPTEIHRWDHGMIRDSPDEKRIKTTSLSVMHHCREIDRPNERSFGPRFKPKGHNGLNLKATGVKSQAYDACCFVIFDYDIEGIKYIVSRATISSFKFSSHQTERMFSASRFL
uniref:Uncharacterized protein n=1 Tax=Vespula pensylvanica TaxID=30213 RepID=A0A834KV08_VESPE|nr:hypothetical protein H0235_012616 [Vespula pensylvanica]